VTLLVIAPDYASHALPLIAAGRAWQRRGQRVVVATGPAMAPLVRSAGMEYTELIMSRGSNAGVIGTDHAQDEEARSLEAFFDASKRGMVATLRYQAEQRSTDLLWRPVQVARRTLRILDVHAPTAVLVDHLAFAATIGLRAAGVPYGDLVLGHPTALPVGGEVYGVPSAWPPAIAPDRLEMASLRETALGVTATFSSAYNDALRTVAPGSAVVDDAFRAHGELVLYNYPAALHGPARTARLPRHAFLGGLVRHEELGGDIHSWLAQPDRRPLVVVSLGTFMSARVDVLARIAASLRKVDVRVAIAIGGNRVHDVGPLPDDWLVRASLPQVALLERAQLLITHGGNNSVTEALHFGVPMLVLPFSTDQFDGAAAIERGLAGVALDPNRASRSLIAGTVHGLLRNPPPAPGLIGGLLRAQPGPELAYDAMATLPPLESPLLRARRAATTIYSPADS
jgi:UDP:flavonoid glycosyltransferase YjiC (YdhE family)